MRWNRIALAVVMAAGLLSGLPAAPSGATFPGNDGRIAWASDEDGDYEIYTMTDTGGGVRQLTMNTVSDRDPAWSPDGTMIAFARYAGSSSEIFVMRRDGTHVDRLTNTTTDESEPTWSPSGNKIAVGSIPPSASDTEVVVMNADGSHRRTITSSPEEDADPSWSPDGDRIAYEHEVSGTDRIFTMDPDGSHRQSVTDASTIAYDPNWSPNGNWLAFELDPGVSAGYDIYKSRPDGTSQTRLTFTGTASDAGPAWSPEGNRIAYFDRVDGDDEIVIMSASGAFQGQLTSNTTFDQFPDWQAT